MDIVCICIIHIERFRAFGWRLGLHAIQGLVILAFFLGLFFRPASRYHPQRDAITHIKQQKEKVKGVKSKEKMKKQKERSLVDFSSLRHKSIRIFLICSSITSLGIYTPIFYLVSKILIIRRATILLSQATHMSKELESMTSMESMASMENMASMSLVQVWLGLGMTCGCLISGMATITQSRSFFISTYSLVQLSIIGTGLKIKVDLLSLYNLIKMTTFI